MKTLMLLLAAALFGFSSCQSSGSVLGRSVAELDNPFATLQLFFNT
ncbi:MAG: hypothetical protein GY930_17390 [bacterium]|nr:hypothetical protein [bacterium]